MTIDAGCTFCGGHAFATRAVFLHPYTPEEKALIRKIDQKKLAALREQHGGWLPACYRCLAEKCPADASPVEPRTPDIVSVQEP